MPLSDIAVRTLKPRERAYKVYDRDGQSRRIKTVALALSHTGVPEVIGPAIFSLKHRLMIPRIFVRAA
jgi:hypothetical protein